MWILKWNETVKRGVLHTVEAAPWLPVSQETSILTVYGYAHSAYQVDRI